jgi:hypothetical protein
LRSVDGRNHARICTAQDCFGGTPPESPQNKNQNKRSATGNELIHRKEIAKTKD